MKAIILAAGAGTRLTGTDVVRPKCLAPFDGAPLIQLQMRALRAHGIDDVTVVIGYGADRVRLACDGQVRFVENSKYAETNSLYSLWLARALLRDDFVVMNCDVLFHPALLADLLTANYDDALLVSYPQPGDAPFGDEEMKVKVRRGQVVDIRKDLGPEDTDGENVGIAKFSGRSGAELVRLMDDIVANGVVRDWAPRAFRDFAARRPLYAVGTRGLPWTEIDTAADYQRAIRSVFPAIGWDSSGAEPLRKGA